MSDLRKQLKLSSLMKWRESLLEKAQTDHVAKVRIVDEYQKIVSDLHRNIEESYVYMREQVSSGSVISVDSLRRIQLFANGQADRLQQSEVTLRQSREVAMQAQSIVCKKLEEMSVMERLIERRSEEHKKGMLVDEQKRLDEQAILRLNSSQLSKNKNTYQ
jgi:flagellar export protein FliJ